MAYGPCFEAALSYAAHLHRDQTRKATPVPYITHLLAVAALVGESGGSEEEVAAALLHDALEDQPDKTSFEDLRTRFGDEVATIVRACSDTETRPKPPWRERKERYLAHLPTCSSSALLVSCADKLHNAETIVAALRDGGDIWSRFKGGREGSLWYYRAVLEVFRRHPTPPPPRLLEALDRAVQTMEELAAD